MSTVLNKVEEESFEKEKEETECIQKNDYLEDEDIIEQGTFVLDEEQQPLSDINPEKTIIKMNNRLGENLVRIKISNIEWERIYVSYYVTVYDCAIVNPDDIDYYLVTGYFMTNAIMEKEKIDDTHYKLTLNITNPGYKRCLPTANYSLYACCGVDVLCRVEVEEEYAPYLQNASKFFIHNGSSVSYNINFSLAETDEGLYPILKILDTKKAKLFVYTKRKKGSSGAKKSLFKKAKDIVKKPLKKIKNKFYSKSAKKDYIKKYYKYVSNKYLENADSRKKIVLFMSEQNDEIKSNLLAVYNRMLERHLDDQFDIMLSARAILNKEKKYGPKSWFDTITKIAKADIIFVDDHCPVFDWLKLNKKKTKLVQLWHAGAGYKGVGYSRWGHIGCPSPFCCHRQYDYCITPSANIGHFFSEQFGINLEQIIPTGMPRMDEYLDKSYQEKKINELYEQFPICKGKKVILFAPTYRGKDRKTAHYPYNLINFEKLYEICGDEYVVIFKMHPWVYDPVPIEEKYQDKFIDANSYPNINDLYYITDLYISDYSSGIFEYSLMRRPALFFAYDEKQYSYTRGFHRDYRSNTPGKICTTFDEVLDAIVNKDFEYEKMGPYIAHHFDYFDSGASDRVIDWFILDEMPQEFIDSIKRKDLEVKTLKNLEFISIKGGNKEVVDEEVESDDETEQLLITDEIQPLQGEPTDEEKDEVDE